MSKKISIGIIGLGHVYKHQIKALTTCNSLYNVAAVCDILSSKHADALNIPFYISIEEMISSVKLDVLLVSVPNSEHYMVCRDLLINGFDVIVEKPATTSVEEFLSLTEIAKSTNALIHTAFHAAFAVDLLWFQKNYGQLIKKYGRITAFRCGFYDPYISGGVLSNSAMNLGNSWIDSGINALSVIDKLLPEFEVEDIKLTQLPQINRAVQGSANIIFNSNNFFGTGLIDTNWSLNINYKTTMLYFGESNHRILLNHSDQQVMLINNANRKKILFSLNNNLPRLTAHYIGVFMDLYSAFTNRRDNRETSLRLHKMLYHENTMKV